MYKQKIIAKFILAFAVLAVIVLTGYILFNRLNLNMDAQAEDTAETVFNNISDKSFKAEDFADNFFVHIVNSIIPAIKIEYESHYETKMPGIIEAAVKAMVSKAGVDLTNPLTYFRFVFTAFNQNKNTKEAALIGKDPNNIPNITNFEDAPEGTIYFSEQDEYYAEEAERQNNVPQIDILEENIKNPDKIEVAKKDPLVLLYHSHTSESYMPETIGNFHSVDERYNVVSVGKIVAETLEKKYKYKVIHDKTYHDTESYAYSYNNSLATVKAQLNKQKSLKVLLDIHRDGFSIDLAEDVKKKLKNDYTVKINNKNAARVMLVIGMANENYSDLEKFAVYIKKKMDTLYPGLFLRIDRKSGKYYNQYFTDYSMLVEVGCSYNTIEEANYTAQLVGSVIGEVLKDLEE